MAQTPTRRCLICGEDKPLTAEQFEVMQFFVKGYSFYCNAGFAESRTKKIRYWDGLKFILDVMPNI